MKSYPNSTNWSDILPIILLGIRTTLKGGLQCTAAELVYGTTLRLPGEIFDSITASDAVPDPCNYVNRLRAAMQQLKAVPPRQHQNKTYGSIMIYQTVIMLLFVEIQYASLFSNRTMVLIRYILSRADKHFTLDVNGKKAVISLDRLKPAYLYLPLSTSFPDPPQYKDLVTDHSTKRMSTGHTTTRSGRRVHWPKHLSSYQTFTGGGVFVTDHMS